MDFPIQAATVFGPRPGNGFWLSNSALQAGCRWFETGIAHSLKPQTHWDLSLVGQGFSGLSSVAWVTCQVVLSRYCMAAQPEKEVSSGRGAIKPQHGFGWSKREVAGRVRLTRRFEDGTGSAVVLDLPWNPDRTGSLLELLPEIRNRKEEQQLGTKGAYGLLRVRVAPLLG